MAKINMYVALVACICGMLLITAWSDHYLDRVWAANAELTDKIIELENLVKEMTPTVLTVTATMYHPVKWQTDGDPHVTADGTRILRRHASKYRFIAVSRDLLTKHGGPLNYGDYVIIEGTNGKYNGVWQVKDTMNRRFTNRIDFLCSPGTKQFKFDEVAVTVLDGKEG
jgi:3D (Asp-Asp-Asp) domain-containing protein